MSQKTALVLGAGGFIGNHLVNHLKSEGYWVRGVDLKNPEYQEKSNADDFILGDLRNVYAVSKAFFLPKQTSPNGKGIFDEVYQLAADMGGAGYIFTGENDANVMHNSATINLNVADAAVKFNAGKVFYSSSACMYPAYNQEDPENPNCVESSAYPAAPDSEYGWEKLFSERLYLSYNRNHGLDVRIARFHNIFGPLGTWQGGKEKAPAAICRKVILSNDELEIWGDGEQTRSFLYIDECIEGIRRLMNGDFLGPVNLGSEEMVTINQLVDIACSVEGKILKKKHIPGPTGVRGRNSDNRLIAEKLGWEPNYPLKKGIEQTYHWIKSQIETK
jgi:nucleoside-diphosphate-sugar epimerase